MTNCCKTQVGGGKERFVGRAEDKETFACLEVVVGVYVFEIVFRFCLPFII